MPDWAIGILAVFAPAVAVVLGITGVIAFGIWVLHKGRMARLELEEKERQAELDRQILGLGSEETDDLHANLQVILDRLNAVESRLGRIEAMDAIETAKRRGHGAVVATEADSTAQEQRRREEQQAEQA